MIWLSLLGVWLALDNGLQPASGQQPAATSATDEAAVTSEQVDFFESRIRPVLIQACLECHASDTEASGELLLDSREGWQRGGSSGAAIVPGRPEESLLMKAIGYDHPHLQMPPDGKLAPEVLSDFRRWIERGAYDPRATDGSPRAPRAQGLTVADAQQHWAYRPLTRVELGSLQLGLSEPAATSQNEQPSALNHNAQHTNALDCNSLNRAAVIDAFIERGLVNAGLKPTPEAAPEQLVRRLYYDLTGLPPTPVELHEFLSDSAPESAYSRLVDRLLMSPRFGETMARRWMDVVRYADSITLRGFVLPEAWRYRDYLIRAFNEDRPFSTMIEEQVAGDFMEAENHEQRQQQLIATTFWTLGNTNLEQQDKTQLEMDYIDEQLDVLGKALLGQTISCARCHDHKFDPIPTHDYYALAGILRSTAGMDHENVSKWIEQPLPLPHEAEKRFEQLAAKRKELVSQIESLKQVIGGSGDEPSKFIELDSLPGLVIDNKQARLVGEWTSSTSNPPIVGEDYQHDANSGKGEKSATFEPTALPPGEYKVRMSYTAGSNRASCVSVRVFSAAGETEILIDQRKPAKEQGTWVELGTFPFEQDGRAFVLVSNADTNGHVIIDAVQFLPTSQVAQSAEIGADPGDRLKEEQRSRLAHREAELKAVDQQLAARPKFMTIVERNAPGDIPIHIRGDVHNLGKTVPRGFLTALQHAPSTLQHSDAGRLELARWLSHDDNPLTTRVYANRVWSWFMGRGLVATLDNFGTTGAEPSHPELLDWLAAELVHSNWSTKSLVRAVVQTQAYRRSSTEEPMQHSANYEVNNREVDPQNRWLWRGHQRRLSVEGMRDAMLLISGELDLSMRGSLIPAGVNNDYNFAHQQPRRSVYQPVFRNSLPQLYETFDFANPSSPVGQRPRSTVATQALELMNHPWVAARAHRAAERLAASMPEAAAEEFMDYLCMHCFARQATSAEVELARATVGDEPLSKVEHEELAMLIHALFASLDFRYLE